MMDKNHYQALFEKANEYYGSDRAEILPFVPEGTETTLEFGCGLGDFSALVKKRFDTESWAVELHPEAAKTAAAKIDKVLNKDAIEALSELPDNKFDAIFFLDILEHLIDPYSLLSACNQKLSDNGVLISSIPNIRYYRALKNYVFKGQWEYKDQGLMDITHIRFFTHSSIGNMFKRLGFDDVSLHGIHETRSNGYRILNALSLNSLWDARYKHFIAVARKSQNIR
ncbi:MAG: class I SAM-dependent methyltransferase [Pseudomonadales bacterium]|nr:class I SAM-dependent methyltransferase [Pseudomonadales bacterium]